MNAKRCKELRRNLRQRGIAVSEVRYVGQKTNWVGALLETRVLDMKCGRAVYQAAKKANAV